MIELRTSVERVDAASVLELIDSAIGKSDVVATVHHELLRSRGLICVSFPNADGTVQFLEEFGKISRYRLQWAEHMNQLPENELKTSPEK